MKIHYHPTGFFYKSADMRTGARYACSLAEALATWRDSDQGKREERFTPASIAVLCLVESACDELEGAEPC